MANEVIAGKWGNNPSRKQKLIAEDYDYNAIQSIVNRKLKQFKIKKSLEQFKY